MPKVGKIMVHVGKNNSLAEPVARPSTINDLAKREREREREREGML